MLSCLIACSIDDVLFGNELLSNMQDGTVLSAHILSHYQQFQTFERDTHTHSKRVGVSKLVLSDFFIFMIEVILDLYIMDG